MIKLSEDDLLLSLKTNGKSKLIEDFNVYEEYYNRFGEKPSTIKIINEDVDFFDVDKIRKFIKNKFPKSKLLFTDKYYSLKHKKRISRKDIWLIDDGYILMMNVGGADSYFNNPVVDIGMDAHFEISDYNNLIIPNIDSKYYNDEIIDKVASIFEDSILVENSVSSIGMVAVDSGEMYVKDFSIKDFDLKYMDIHYGEGFSTFNRKLIKKLRNDKKGLVLLHGKAGTGKTYYIRHLLSKISKEDKSILYFPPSMVGMITDPSFVNFINSWVNDNEKSCIVLIEDAEPLLISRDEGRNIGITNLLNLTDGLLNDIFGIQIIATFNTNLDNLDDALLRPERLIARKEFRPLKKERALKLSKKINISENKIKDNMTLAEIYSIKKKNEVLLHDVDEPRKSIGF